MEPGGKQGKLVKSSGNQWKTRGKTGKTNQGKEVETSEEQGGK